jgi:DNA-binding response OmpR family regulator
MNIILIEDNTNLRESVKGYLALEGYEVQDFTDLISVEQIMEINPDCIILDVMLPSGDGMLLAKKIREKSSVPIIFLTARVEESDRITGLELGADDYITKPFSSRELVLRVNAVLRRSTQIFGENLAIINTPPINQGQSSTLESSLSSKIEYELDSHNLQMDFHSHQLFHDTNEISVTPIEWTILVFLVKHPKQVLSRLQILEHCLQSIAEGSERTVDTHIKNIRHKLDQVPWINTVRGFGYRFMGTKQL